MKHFTEILLVEKILKPCLQEPWEEKLNKIKTQSDFLKVHKEFLSYKVLEPAVGEGIFLLEAYRKIKSLEQRLFQLYQVLFDCDECLTQKTLGFYSLKNFYGFEVDPKSLQVCKENLLELQKDLIEEHKTLEKPSTIDVLENILLADALFNPWPQVDLVVGNPPFIGGSKIRTFLGDDYIFKLKKVFGKEYKGHADYSCYWYTKALKECPAGIPIGFLTTNTLTQNNSREASLEKIFETGGEIFDAWTSFQWPGEAVVHIIIVCFKNKKPHDGLKRLDGKVVESICSRLQDLMF